jgi:hypothetical protein
VTFWTAACRTSTRHKGTDLLRAAIVTALVPAAAAALLMWLVPAGCDIRGSTTVYRWTCLLPGLVFVSAVPMAGFLSIAMIVNQRLDRPFPDGWLTTVLAVGLLSQLLLSVVYLIVLDTAYRGQFLTEVIFIPQPFVAGAISGAVYWTALHWQRFINTQRSSK